MLDTMHDTITTATETPLAPNARKAFMIGGKAIVTIEGRSSRYTFKIVRSDEDSDGKRPICYFVNLLTGPNNVEDYTYIGLLNLDSGQIKLTRKSCMRDDSAPVVAFNWCMRRIWAGLEIAPARIYHVGRCGRCGRALTVPTSIESGFGPECSAKMGGN